jgi:hypothetical protein
MGIGIHTTNVLRINETAVLDKVYLFTHSDEADVNINFQTIIDGKDDETTFINHQVVISFAQALALRDALTASLEAELPETGESKYIVWDGELYENGKVFA